MRGRDEFFIQPGDTTREPGRTKGFRSFWRTLSAGQQETGPWRLILLRQSLHSGKETFRTIRQVSRGGPWEIRRSEERRVGKEGRDKGERVDCVESSMVV